MIAPVIDLAAFKRAIEARRAEALATIIVTEDFTLPMQSQREIAWRFLTRWGARPTASQSSEERVA